MKLLATLASATLAGAIVLPDASVFEKIQSSAESSFKETVEFISDEVAAAARDVKTTLRDEFEKAFDAKPKTNDGSELLSLEEHHDKDFSNFTIYELISKSKHVTKFAKLVEKHEKVLKLLNSTDANYTLFVPIDEAFEEHKKHHHKKPSDEFIESALNYHIGLGNYPAGRIVHTHTLPTALEEPWLGDQPQRLRTSAGLLSGIRINVFSKVVAANFKAKNGWIHAVNKVLGPPFMIGRELSFFPSQFSTLLLAYDKTEFVNFIHNVKMVGSTVFAPTNKAWAKLGPKANAFLFNTEQGKKYLTALLKYQIVANTTLYTDAVYYGDEEDSTAGMGHQHFELHSLLDNKPLGVDIHSFGGWSAMVVNGYVNVGFADAVGKNGVIQIVDDVPIPPHKKGGKSITSLTSEIDVEDLKEILAEYVGEDSHEEMTGNNDWFGEL